MQNSDVAKRDAEGRQMLKGKGQTQRERDRPKRERDRPKRDAGGRKTQKRCRRQKDPKAMQNSDVVKRDAEGRQMLKGKGQTQRERDRPKRERDRPKRDAGGRKTQKRCRIQTW